ncbi:MAG: hypothetical protein ILO34_00385 [Kiritimatiellae bacterium]|nr:hypothetical protein [Kiritimatiellia bacterium]
MKTNIGYKLAPNMTKTAGKAPYFGVAIPVGSLAYDNILSRMVESGTFLNKATCQWMLSAFYEYAAAAIAGDTVRVNTGTVSLYPAISGSFDSEDGAFDPGRNKLYVGASLSKGVRDALAELSPVFGGEGGGDSKVEISSEIDIDSQRWFVIDGTKEFRLAGIDLHVPDGEDESLSLVAADGVTKVCDITVVATDVTQRIVCRLPDDAAIEKGEYIVRLASHGIDPTARLAVRTVNVELVSPVVPPAARIDEFYAGSLGDGKLQPANFVTLKGARLRADENNLPSFSGVKNGESVTGSWTLDQIQVNTDGELSLSYMTSPMFAFDPGSVVTIVHKGVSAAAVYDP